MGHAQQQSVVVFAVVVVIVVLLCHIIIIAAVLLLLCCLLSVPLLRVQQQQQQSVQCVGCVLVGHRTNGQKYKQRKHFYFAGIYYYCRAPPFPPPPPPWGEKGGARPILYTITGGLDRVRRTHTHIFHKQTCITYMISCNVRVYMHVCTHIHVVWSIFFMRKSSI